MKMFITTRMQTLGVLARDVNLSFILGCDETDDNHLDEIRSLIETTQMDSENIYFIGLNNSHPLRDFAGVHNRFESLAEVPSDLDRRVTIGDLLVFAGQDSDKFIMQVFRRRLK